MNDTRQLKSYVWHGETCFFVSTIERDSSAAVSPPPRFFETIVWLYDWESQTRGEQIGSDGSGPAFRQHMAVCERLYRDGKLGDDE